MNDIEDYITAELGTEPLPEFEETANETLALTVPEVEVLPAIVDRYEVVVDDKVYGASKDRLFLMTKSGETVMEKFICGLIVILAYACDQCSNSWGKVIRFKDLAGVIKELFIHNSDITTNGNTIVKNLSNMGLQISTDSRMKDALLNYLNMAPPMEKDLAVCSDRIGWHGNSYLFPDNSVIGISETRVVYTGASFRNQHSSKGTLQEWTDNVAALCKGNSMLIFAMCVSFATVLLRLLKIESGGYHIFGESSTGKSTTLYVGASVHGEPEPLMGTWRSTANGNEGKAKNSNDSLMILGRFYS